MTGWFRRRGLTTLTVVDEVADLFRRARDGDERALEQFVRATQADVWRFCSYLASPAEADDLTQETYLRAFRSMSRFRGESTVMTWLLSIARRAVADHVRQRSRERRRDSKLTVVDRPDEHAGTVELDLLVRSLDPDRRAAFVLTQVLGYTYEQAAQACGCEIGTIRSRVYRAREDLRAALDRGDVAEQQ
jgi:RNA polymerase sigma-70 factor (ECF subfamily)